MSALGLQVRCIASTRISAQTWQREEPREEDGHRDEKESHEQEAPGNVEEDEGRRDSSERAADPPDDDRGSSRSPSSDSAEEHDSVSSQDSNHHEASPKRSLREETRQESCIQEAQLSPDGTCIFTSDYNRSFTVYPLPNPHSDDYPHRLEPYAQLTSPDPIWSFACNPYFNPHDPTTTHILLSRRDRYITLHNALYSTSNPAPTTSPLNIAAPIASYKLIDPLTEAVTAPLSLIYSHPGTHFFCGVRNKIHVFDLEYADEPSFTISTIPSSRSKAKGGGRGFKGWVSALALSPPTSLAGGGLLAAGARTRHIGIYDAISGSEVTTFSLPGTVDGRKVANAHMQHIIGDGVSSLKYSPCGKYLYVAERHSDVLLIYDVRNFSLSVAHCAGRKALTKQKLGFDVWNAGKSVYDIEGTAHEVWGGGTDGTVRVWRDPCMKEGAVEADEVVRVGEGEAPVVGALVHPEGGVVVAACGVVGVGEDAGGVGVRRGGGVLPGFREWGSVDVLQLS